MVIKYKEIMNIMAEIKEIKNNFEKWHKSQLLEKMNKMDLLSLIKIREKAQRILEIKRDTTLQANKFISKFMSLNLINKMDQESISYQNILKRNRKPAWTNKYKQFDHYLKSNTPLKKKKKAEMF